MNQTASRAAALVAAVLFSSPASAQNDPAWKAPAGIPVPAFGISQAAPSKPAGWTTERKGFYYVDQDHSASTDEGNTFGHPGRPRKSIPAPVPAGSAVFLNGKYAKPHVTPKHLQLKGTESSPVWILAADPAKPPRIGQNWDIQDSTYFIVDHLVFEDGSGDPRDADNSVGVVRVYGPASYGAIRHSDISGNLRAGGLGLGNGEVDHMVIWKNKIHHNGDVEAATDQDRHGVTVGGRGNKSHVWIVDNELSYNSGDGIQVNGGKESMRGEGAAQESTQRFIYIGRNKSHHNKQTGMWTKQAQDVIFSENESFAHRGGNSSSGACMGYQYGPHRVWFLFNRMHDCEYGIQGQSDSQLGFTTTTPQVYVIGNVFWNLHNDGKFSSHAAYMFRSGVKTDRYFVNNTVVGVDQGIEATNAREGALEIVNNIFVDVGEATSGTTRAIHMADERIVGGAVLRNNAFAGNFQVVAGRQRHSSAGDLKGGGWSGNRGAKTLFRDKASGDFTLLPGSDAVDAGTPHPVYETFRTIYGLDIARDANGVPRPQGKGWDLGAFELPVAGTQ